jgi:hypothetical protein
VPERDLYQPDAVEQVEPDELIIDLRDRDLVGDAIEKLGITIAHEDQVEAFDLAKLKLAYPEGLGFEMAIDPVLAELRRRFSARCGGWVPLLGKNRTLSNQFGAYPQTRSQADFDPDCAKRPDGTGADPAAGRGVRVGILDTKLYRHPDLEGHYETPATGTTFTPAPDAVTPWEKGHATFVAGMILAQAPAATLVVRDVLNSAGRASVWATVVELAKFLEDDIDVLNLAMGTRAAQDEDGRCPVAVQRAIERLSPHMVIAAAAGNHGEIPGVRNGLTRTAPTWPAALTGVVAVGATKADGTPASYSPNLPWVTCSALGDGLVSTYLPGKVKLRGGDVKDFPHGYALWKGTSFATATVSGAIAARTKPGEVTATGAFHSALAAGDVVKGFAWHDEAVFA